MKNLYPEGNIFSRFTAKAIGATFRLTMKNLYPEGNIFSRFTAKAMGATFRLILKNLVFLST